MSTPAVQKAASYEDVLKRIREIKKSASQGDKVTDVTDPTNSGTVTPPTHPSEKTTNAELPGGNNAGVNSANPKSIESKQVVGTLETTEKTIDGNAKDDAVNSPTAKIASEAAAMIQRLNSLLPKSASGGASAPAEKAAAKAEPSTESKAKAADPTDKGNVAPTKKNGPEGLPGKATVGTAPDNGAKSAATETIANDIDLANIKLASEACVRFVEALTSTENGVKLASAVLKEARGAKDAEQLIANALAAREKFAADAAAEQAGRETADYLFKNASASEIEFMQKVASVHGPWYAAIDARADLKDDEKNQIKLAYTQGVMDAATMADATAAAPAGPEGSPAPVGDLPGGASEEAGDEDIIAVIEQLVASGEIDPALAEQVLAMLSGGGAAAPAGEGAPVEGESETEEEKSAASKDPVLAFTGAHRKNATAETKLAAEILRATLPAAVAA